MPILSMARSIMQYPALLAAFRNNNFSLGAGEQAVFRETSRFNHACVPNAQGNFNATTGCFAVHSLQRIVEGEEIVISYLAELMAPREVQQGKLMEAYGFYCGCAICDAGGRRGRESEKGRMDMNKGLATFIARETGQQGREGDLGAEMGTNLQMIGLMAAEGVAGRELATLYLATAELAAELGQDEQMRLLCQEGLRLEADCLGRDNPIFEESRERVKRMEESFRSKAAM